MSILSYAVLFLSSFVNVFLLGFQSKNVQRSRYLLAAIISFGITLANFTFVRLSGSNNPVAFLIVSGLAGSAGIVTAIWVGDKFRSKNESS